MRRVAREEAPVPGEEARRASVTRAIQEALRDAPFSLRDLAEEMDGSYGTLREWSRGARTPTDANVERIAGALDSRARRLAEIAERMRRAIRDGGA